MVPMGLISTPFISFHDIEVDEIDLYGDAWGFNSEFGDVIQLLEMVRIVPEKRLTDRLIEKIKKQAE
jgi:hypothetical protein